MLLIKEWRAGRSVLLSNGIASAKSQIPGRKMTHLRDSDILPCLVKITAEGEELLSQFVDAVRIGR